jgi:transcriptional regulator with PAS, ATPase and Fis domain
MTTPCRFFEIEGLEQRLSERARGSLLESLPGARVEAARSQTLEAELLGGRSEALLPAARSANDEPTDVPRPLPISAEAAEAEHPSGVIAKSLVMRKLVEMARRLAQVDSTVLVTGESGAGKERIARLLHEESRRASGPLIAVNCGAISESLLEPELFGHARGAFTGAHSDRPGLFEAANGGTIFLDEVGEVSPGMQVKLLRVMQSRELRRVGETKLRRVDVRVVAATNRDLAQAVAGGTFRQDLYYRLKVVELRVPSLRERPEDLLPLAHVLLSEVAERMQRDVSSLSPSVAQQLLRYDWPGNVRELQNAMERCVALAQSNHVELDDLPPELRDVAAEPRTAATTTASPLRATGPVRPLRDIEKDYILAALQANDGNQTRTAEQLQIGLATLYRKLKSYREQEGETNVTTLIRGLRQSAS